MTQGKGKSKGKFRYQGQILPDCHRQSKGRARDGVEGRSRDGVEGRRRESNKENCAKGERKRKRTPLEERH